MESPKSLIEAVQFFSDPDRAHDYLVAMRWPDGIVCPHCQSSEVTYMSKYRRWKCRGCRKQFGVKYNTVFENSPLSLSQWLVAMWLVLNCKNGISSYEIARDLNVTQKTAWFMLHRIRKMMEEGSMEVMSGTVEVDETVIGQKSKTMHTDKRQEQRERGFPKTIIFGLRERGGNVQTMVVNDASKETLQGIINEVVEPGSVVCSDSWKGYLGLSERYTHGVVDHKKGQYTSGEFGEFSTNGMENYWSLFKRGYHGTYIQISTQHAFRYLAEEDFRYNTRKEKDGERFVRALTSLNGRRLTWRELTESHLVYLDRGMV